MESTDAWMLIVVVFAVVVGIGLMYMRGTPEEEARRQLRIEEEKERIRREKTQKTQEGRRRD